MSAAAVIWDQNPAVRREDWLPFDTQFEELNELHERHVALLRELYALGNQRLALERHFEAEDDAQTDALREAHRSRCARS